MVRIILFLKNLFAKKKTFKDHIHLCYSHDADYLVKSKYIVIGGYKNHRGFKLVYNVWEVGVCDQCCKTYKRKVATNISSSRLYNKFGIKIKLIKTNN